MNDSNKSSKARSNAGKDNFRKPKPDAARTLAFDLLTEVNQNGSYANILLPQLLGSSELELRDKAFATELSYGTLRMQGKYDFAIKSHIDRPFDELEPRIIDLLRMGCHQIFHMRTPVHAAVGATVEVARKVVGESKASYVNALLRAITRDLEIYERLEADESIDRLFKLSILYSHPEWIIQSYFDSLKDWDSVIELLTFNNVAPAPHLVAWRGKSTREQLMQTGGEVLQFSRYGIVSSTQPNDYPEIRNRNAGVQDFGSQLVSEIFYDTHNPQEAQSWLDLCAGPGGKAAWLFNALVTDDPLATFQANEPSEHRAELVARVIPRQNISSIDGRDAADFGAHYDRILVDAPCTGLGALRRRPEARWRKTPSDLKNLVVLQRELIDSAYALLKPAGILAYSTCSPHLAETFAQVLDTLHRHKDLELIDVSQFHELPTGSLNKNGTMQLWSHLHNSDAMFLALFRKKIQPLE
ncbi:MAG: transcription antitermination factor NusB [Actinomycetes bacterium]